LEIPVSHHSQLVFCRRSRVCRNLFKHVRGGGTASKRSIVVSVVIVVLFFAALVFIVLLVLFFMLTLLVVFVVFLLIAFPWLSTFLASTSLLFVGFRHQPSDATSLCGVMQWTGDSATKVLSSGRGEQAIWQIK
jgi:hypothetical protein